MTKKIIDEFIEQASKLKVLVIGETIVDEFQKVTYQGHSMKSFCPVFRVDEEDKQVQEGGAKAIANHLKGFVKELDFISNPENTIVKSRLIDANSGQKHMETNRFDTSSFNTIKVNSTHYDVIVIADFGHGFCDKIELTDGFHLMCQTNSHNFGFNRLSKWKEHKKKSVCLDLREASLQINHRIDECTNDIARYVYNYEMNTEHLFITLGRQGAVFVNQDHIERHKAYKSEIVDTIGAGDTFYAFSVLTSHLSLTDQLMIPSLAASLSTTWLCNEDFVTPEKLLNYADRFI